MVQWYIESTIRLIAQKETSLIACGVGKEKSMWYEVDDHLFIWKN